MLNNADNLNVKYESSVWGNDPVPRSLFAVGHVWGRGESAQILTKIVVVQSLSQKERP